MMFDEMHTRVRKSAYPAVVCVLACVAATNARAQQPDVTTAATKIAQELKAKKVKTVAVFDFVGPGENLTALGPKVADDFSIALEKSGGRLHVKDRAALGRSTKEFDYGLPELEDPSSIDDLAAYLGINVAVLGTISRGSDAFSVSVRVTHAGRNGVAFVETEHFSVPVSDDTTKLAETYLQRGAAEPDHGPIDKTIPNSGTKGYSYPKCIYCPQAQYTDLAVKLKFQGTVELVGVVTADGRFTDARVIKHVPGGLTTKAIETVEQWRFQPATGPDGKPAAVRLIIEVSFHLSD